MRLVCLLFLAALVATHALDEGFVEVLDDSSSDENLAEDIQNVVPFLDADELIQMKGMVEKANTALQNQLDSDAKSTHLAKLEVEKAASAAQLSYKTKDAAAQGAMKTAMKTKSAADVKAATDAKKEAASHKDKNTKLQAKQSEARITASTALKKAQDAGVKVNLPTLDSKSTSSSTTSSGGTSSSSTTSATSASTSSSKSASSTSSSGTSGSGGTVGAAQGGSKKKGLLPDPPAVGPKKKDTQLEVLLKDRKKKREKREAHDLRKKYEEAKVEKQQADFVLSQKMAKYQKIQTKEAESRSAKSAARKQQHVDEAKIVKAHMAIMLAKTDYKQTAKAEGLAKAMVRGEMVTKEVASSQARSGGARRNLKKADKRRGELNERLKTAKANIVSDKLAVVKAKAATQAAKAALTIKEEDLRKINRSLAKADGQFSNAVYTIKGMHGQADTAKEDVDQAKAEDKLANKKYKEDHALATAAAMKVNGAKGADEKTRKALLGDPREAKKEALLKVKDQNGISDKGTELIAAKGAIRKEYEKKFAKLPLPSSGRNPILEAEAKAQLSDKSADAALKVATTPGPAAIAAAKIPN